MFKTPMEADGNSHIVFLINSVGLSERVAV